MKYLLDTHIVLWLFNDKDRISKKVLKIFSDFGNTFYVSVATLHEVVIKTRNKGIKLKVPYSEFEAKIVSDYGFKTLNIDPKHIRELDNLTINPGHNDPFDHVIISQAMSERMYLISADTKIPFYTKQGLKLVINE